jgi:hypothetical protein
MQGLQAERGRAQHLRDRLGAVYEEVHGPVSMMFERALDGLEAGLDEVLADELTRQVKLGMTAARPSYLSQVS